jgi:amino acid adenylation domain-containing protein/non-ribosomal peptide synthase protein (TIGR01720 family)
MERDEITARLAGLSPAKRALLERRRRGEAAAQVAAIGRRPDAGPAPVSFSQQRMWFLDQLAPGSPTYNLRVLLRLSGPLDRPALARSFQEVVHRHEVLRTAFREEGGVPVQVVLPHLDLPLPSIDLSALPAPLRQEESQRRTREIAGGSFDLAHPPLLRVALVVLGSPGLGASDHHLIVVMHHIVSDGWSMGVLVREIGALYEAFQAGRPGGSFLPGLPELPIQYADFAVWQRGWLTGEVLERDLGYWRERLAGAAAELDLPTDRPRPAVQTSRGEAWRFSFDAGVMEAVEALARREGATPFMVIAAGLLALLSRLSGQSDLSIGSPIAGRNRPEVEGLIGFFVNTLVLRADVSDAGDGDFLGLLRHVREVALGALAHQDVPFEKLVAEIAPERDMSRTPLFQVALAFQNAPQLDAKLAGLELHPEQIPVDSAKFDLAFIVGGESGALAASLEYATDLFDRATAVRLCRQWLRLMAAATAAPEGDLARLDLLSPAERQQLLLEWNDTRAPQAFQEEADAAPDVDTALLHQPFEQRADRQPEAVAVLWEGSAVTYRELESRANRLAGFLKKLGAGPGAPVGVWMDRSLDMVVALLGACKAGAPYLPIDAGWPADRAEAVLAGTEAGLVLTRRDHLAAVQALQWRLPRLADAICLDVETADLPAEPLDVAATRDLFDVVAERAVDWVTAAGFWSAYTGDPFPEAEVVEYRDRVLSLAEPWLGTGPDARSKRVLEIGSGSGLILRELAPRVARYVGLDPSERTQKKNREQARERTAADGLTNVDWLTGFAHEIETLPETPAGAFDLVILASTTQFFPGLVYLEKVLKLALSRLAPGGALLIADVLDPRRREDFRRSLADYAALHPGSAAARAGGASGNEARELYVDEGFFADLPAALPETAGVRVLHRQEGFPNELRFRYDVVVRKGAEQPAVAGASPHPPGPPLPPLHPPSPGEGGIAGRSKRVWTGWHVAGSPSERLQPAASPIDIAYVIHTSGSTGAPKGIVVQHRPAVELTRWINSTHGVGPGDRLLFITSPAFDLSVYDVFGVLGAGGTVHVASEAVLRDPEELVRLLVAGGVTIWDSAPAALQQLAPLFPERAPESKLRLVLLSGDWIPVRLPDAVRASFPSARVIALGGATEATVWSNWFPVGEVDPRWPSIPYGRPMTNARYHVLDRGLQPCPIGIPGDLHIGGRCLCVGYARLPEMTAEKFIPDPFSADFGGRLYATGDRARYGQDGNLEFLGRVDQQVKVRGYRIELEEIEAVLARHPQVREAAVLAREDIPGEKRLVGYVVPAAEPGISGAVGAVTPAELRAALQQVMPEYMVPWTFVLLESMPVTANGKLDRKALPAPQDVLETSTGYVEPRSDLERAIAAVWQELLHLPRVGLHDNFFELGGSSLLATQVISRARQLFAVELPLRALFEDRTPAGLALRVEALRAAGPATAATAATAVPPLVAEPRTGALPLSFSQHRLWLIDQLDPGSPLYNIPGAVRLTGRLEPELLRRSLAEVVRRHEVLRTTFQVAAGQPVQVIADPSAATAAELPLPVIDLAGLPARRREEETARLKKAEALRPFDLAQGPLLRATLLRLGGDQNAAEHLALLTFHHIVSDAWSIEVFLREVAAVFDAYHHGRPSPLPELPVQYADFAVWQRRWLTGEALERELDYWRQQLAGMPRILDLPTDRLRPAVQSFRGSARRVSVPPRTVAALAGWAAQRGGTLFMAVLSGFATLLSRYSGQRDLAVGSGIAGRDRRETEGLIGFFINTLILRVDLTGDPTLETLFGRVRATALGAYAHQSLPFERIVEELAPVRDPSHSPLFQVVFSQQSAPVEKLRLPGLDLEPVPVVSGTAKVDLLLSLNETEGGLSGLWEYCIDLFDGSTIDRLTAHLTILLEGIAADPARKAFDLPLLSAAESHQAAVEWNDSQVRYPRSFVHEMFAEQVRRAPDALAVADGGRRLTYAELDAKAEALASRLRGAGVGPEVVVALCAERSLDMVLATIAVPRTGGAYLPLDPTHPPGRLRFMIADSQARVLLTQKRLAAMLPHQKLHVLLLDDEASWERVPAVPEMPETGRIRVQPENPLYVIYTSGSTGTPKGCVITHRSLANVVHWHHAWSGEGPGHRASQAAAPAFDGTVFEIWPCLTSGGSIHVLDDDTRLSPPDLVRWMTRHEINFSYLPTALAEAVVNEPWPAPPGGLAFKALHTAGDRLRRRPDPSLPFAFYNLYGPTEITVLASGQLVEPHGEGLPPIGRPIANTRLQLVDRRLRPVPVGVAGEIVIGGPGVARGYLRRPDLTAERFLPDPFATLWGESGTRLYRTGDLARWLPDGQIDFIGRLDQQVKIRGLRIELGEIETALGDHPGVQQCAVLVREDVPGEKTLVAYLAPREGYEPDVRELRSVLAQSLPSFMVPAAFVILPALPLSPNGKIDRAALPAPPRTSSDREIVPPRTPSETALCQIWAQVLGREQVGIHDNFFELGGDSILCIQVVSRAQQSGLPLSARDIFQHQTVAELAVAAEALAPGSGPDETAEIPLTPSQQALFEEPALPLRAVRRLGLREAADPLRLARALHLLARHHGALRFRFQRDEAGQWHQAGAAAERAEAPLSGVDLSALPEARQNAALESAASGLQEIADLAQGPALRAVLFASSEDRHSAQTLCLALHPLIADDASWRILLADLEAAYRAAGEEAVLPPVPTSFAQWAARLAEHARSTAVAGELDYWLDASRTLARPLPLDRPEGDSTTASARPLVLELDAEETRSLRDEVSTAYHSRIDDALLTALVQAFSGWTGEPRLLIDLEGPGREALFDGADTARTVGRFAIRFPVLLELDRKAQSPGEHLKSIKEQLRAVPRGGIGFGLLRYQGEEAQVERLRAMPAADVAFRGLGERNGAPPEPSALFTPAGKPAADAPGRHILEIRAEMVDGRLRLTFTYDERLHDRRTLQALADRFLSSLRALIAHGRSGQAGGFTPSDFPEARFSQKELDTLMAQIGKRKPGVVKR